MLFNLKTESDLVVLNTEAQRHGEKVIFYHICLLMTFLFLMHRFHKWVKIKTID